MEIIHWKLLQQLQAAQIIRPRWLFFPGTTATGEIFFMKHHATVQTLILTNTEEAREEIITGARVETVMAVTEEIQTAEEIIIPGAEIITITAEVESLTN